MNVLEPAQSDWAVPIVFIAHNERRLANTPYEIQEADCHGSQGQVPNAKIGLVSWIIRQSVHSVDARREFMILETELDYRIRDNTTFISEKGLYKIYFDNFFIFSRSVTGI